jgi:hypothetical protein
MRAVLRQQEQLEALLERGDTFEPVRKEVERELTVLYNYERKHSKQARDNAQRAVRAVRMAIKRFYEKLLNARDERGRPNPVLRSFAAHLEKYLLRPSSLCSLAAGLRTQSAFPDCFSYEPPRGIHWII